MSGGGLGSRQYRVTLVVEPYEAEARRLARHPRVVDLAEVAEEVAEVARLGLGGQVPDENLLTQGSETRGCDRVLGGDGPVHTHVAPSAGPPAVRARALVGMLRARIPGEAPSPPCPRKRTLGDAACAGAFARSLRIVSSSALPSPRSALATLTFVPLWLSPIFSEAWRAGV